MRLLGACFFVRLLAYQQAHSQKRTKALLKVRNNQLVGLMNAFITCRKLKMNKKRAFGSLVQPLTQGDC
jgi:hypothetical protein